MFRTYEMDGSGYTPHVWDSPEQAQAWVAVHHSPRMYAKAEGLRGRCRPAVEHRGEYDPLVEEKLAQMTEGNIPCHSSR